MRKIFLIKIFLIILIKSQAQTIGSPFITNYSSKKYNGHHQVWTITQDNNGILYFGTTTEIMEFDGSNWRKILLPNTGIVRSLYKAKSGIIYVGGSGQIGYLAPDSVGKMSYFSLNHLIPESEKQFQDVWETFEGDDGIYFRSVNRVFRYNEKTKKITVFKPKIRFNPLTYVPNFGIVVTDYETYYKIQGDSLVLLPQPKKYKDIFITRFFPYDDGKMLCVSAKKLLIYNFKAKPNEDPLTDFHTDADSLFEKTRLYMGCPIGDTAYAISSLTNGIFIINKKGKLIEHIDITDGLLTNQVWITFLAADGSLWAGLDKGIAKIDYNLPIRQFNDKNGFDESVTNAVLFNKNIFVSTMTGLFKIDPTTDKKPQKIPGINYNTWNFNIFTDINNKQRFLISSSDGVAQYSGDKANIIIPISYNYFSLYSKYFKNTLFITNLNRIFAYKIVNNKYIPFDTLNFNGLAIRCFEDKDSTLWITTFFNGIYRVKLNADKEKIFAKNSLKLYDTTKGFTDIRQIKPFEYNNKLYFCTLAGLYEFDKTKDTVFLTSDFNKYFLTKNRVIEAFYIIHNILYLLDNNKIIKIIPDNGSFEIDSISFLALSKKAVNNIYVDSLFNVYDIGTDGLFIIYNKKFNFPFNAFKTLIRKFTINNDSTIFYGNWFENNIYSNKQPQNKIPTIAYKNNTIEIEYSSPFYIGDENIEYSYKLEGFDKEWSKWTTETKVKYTNLHEGKYIFRVKAKSVFGFETEETKFEFTILSPWYRTTWAYLSYLIFFAAFTYLAARLYSLRLKRQNIKLEQLVKERTAVIAAQNEELMQQKEEILAQRDELAQLNLELEKLSIVARESVNPIFLIKPNGDFLWVNEAFVRYYGVNFDEFVSKNPNLFAYYNDTDFVEKIKYNLFELKIPFIYESKVFNSKDNKTYWMQTSLTPIIDDDTKTIKLIVAVETDITQIKEYEKQLLDKNTQIQIQNNILREKNEYIEASIRYAQTIQKAILPNLSAFNEYFVAKTLFLPKDIVSGDFYFAIEKNNYIFFGVADCTGHGVPGAFMSLISSQILHNVIIEKNILVPSEILNNLDIDLTSILSSYENRLMDGLDIALCRFEKDSKQLTFAGAKRSAYVFQDNSLIKLQSTSRSIGGYSGLTKSLFFNDIEIKLQKNSIIYLFTDGFTDQNNYLRKKYTTIRLIQLLENIATEDIDKQFSIITTELNNWKDNQLQRDDITFIILKIK